MSSMPFACPPALRPLMRLLLGPDSQRQVRVMRSLMAAYVYLLCIGILWRGVSGGMVNADAATALTAYIGLGVMAFYMLLRGNFTARWKDPALVLPQCVFAITAIVCAYAIVGPPRGTVLIISPWNFPVNLTFSPLAGVFAAGNRTMIKPSEFTPASSELMARMFRTAFDETEVAVVTGGPAVGEAFSRLPFDHLLFTGATSIAYHVMRAAADNLVPLTLELGGKSPVVVGRNADMKDVATKVMTGKMMNAGQICIAPDYVFVPEGSVDGFVANAESAVKKMYPTLKDNPDYTSVINQRHYDRLQGYLEDAKKKGAQIVEINPAKEDFSQQPHHKIPPTIIVNPTDDMKVMQDEIFGPILPVKTYKGVDEAIGFINGRDRPLALYYFGKDEAERDRVLSRTTSGGVAVNDVIMHVSMEDLPFGGIGPSGMGAYHGLEGFRTFSHNKAVYKQAKMDIGGMLRPPYGDKFRKMLEGRVKR